jgi:hypothetical protein
MVPMGNLKQTPSIHLLRGRRAASVVIVAQEPRKNSAQSVLSREELILATLATEGREFFKPYQTQRLFFLIDRRLGDRLGGSLFDFQAGDYGPFDAAVDAELRKLQRTGYIEIRENRGEGITATHEYRVTPRGLARGQVIWEFLEDRSLADGLATLARFVRPLGFVELVAAVFKAYPEMRENAIFSERG